MRVNSSPNVMFFKLTVYQFAVWVVPLIVFHFQIEQGVVQLAVYQVAVGSLGSTSDRVGFSNRAFR